MEHCHHRHYHHPQQQQYQYQYNQYHHQNNHDNLVLPQRCSRNQQSRSFSSALLDAICKSTAADEEIIARRRSCRNKSVDEEEFMHAAHARFIKNNNGGDCVQKCFLNHFHHHLEYSCKSAAAHTSCISAQEHRDYCRQWHSATTTTATNSSDWSDSAVCNNSAYLSSDAESIYRRPSSSGRAGSRGSRSKASGSGSSSGSGKGRWVSSCMAAARNNFSSDDPSEDHHHHHHHVTEPETDSGGGLHMRSMSCLMQQQQQQEEPKFKWKQNKPKQKHHHKDSCSSSKKKLKPVHPNSPGRRLASFLNSLFTVASTKKAKISASSSVSETTTTAHACYSSMDKKLQQSSSSSSSATTSFLRKNNSSRSCSSASAAAAAARNNGCPRSVKFYPSEIHIHSHRNPVSPSPKVVAAPSPAANAESLKFCTRMTLRRLERDTQAAAAMAQNIIAKYSHSANRILEAVARDLNKFEQEQEQEDDDNASCASSDLFELENLSAIDIKKYQEELPVYETTRLEPTKSLARGLRC